VVTTRFDEAPLFARRLHQNQVRKGEIARGARNMDTPVDLQEHFSGGLAPVDYLGDPQVLFRLEPDSIGHPALFPQSQRYFGWMRRFGCVDTRW
jgi:hypothetical protein